MIRLALAVGPVTPTPTPLLIEEVLHAIFGFVGIKGATATVLVLAGVTWHYGGEVLSKAMTALFVAQVLFYVGIGVMILGAVGIGTGVIEVGGVEANVGMVWGWIQALLDLAGGVL